MGHGSMSIQLKTARLIIIFINMIFFLIGAALIGQGLELLITQRFQNFTEFISNLRSTLLNKENLRLVSDEILYIIMIIPGLILLSLGFFGCSGAIAQIRCLLYCYFWIMGIVLGFQTTIIISFITFRSKLTRELISTIRLFIRDVYRGSLEDNLQSTSVLWDWIMYHFECCGIESKNDFDTALKWNRTNPWWNNSMSIEHQNFKYPLTCCPMSNTDSIVFNRILSCAINGSDIYEINCYQKMFDMVHSMKNIILIIIIFILLIEMFALTFVLIIRNRNQIRGISNVMERSPPSYSSRTRINNGNFYFQI